VQSTGAHELEGPTRAELIFLNDIIKSIICTVNASLISDSLRNFILCTPVLC